MKEILVKIFLSVLLLMISVIYIPEFLNAANDLLMMIGWALIIILFYIEYKIFSWRKK